MARLVHLCPRYAPARGGVEIAFQRLCEHFASEGHQVEVWTTDALTVRGLTARGEPRATPADEVIAGVRVRRFPARRWPGQRVWRTLAHAVPGTRQWHADTLRWTPWLPDLRRACARADVPADVVHAAGLPYSTLLLAGEQLAARTRARLVMSPFTHVAADGAGAALMRRAYLSPFNVGLLGAADVVLAQTEDEREMLTAAGLRRERVQVLGLGVDVARVSGGRRAAQRQQWGIADDVVVVGHLANKSRDKGTLDLLEAMSRVWQAHPSVRVVLAGPAMPSFSDAVKQRPIDARVIDLGPLTDDGLRDFLAGIDVFALPSYVESFGLAALEAAAMDVPVVLYAHGGPRAIWTDQVNALLAPAGDREALSRALSRVCGDAALRRRLGMAGAAHARQFTWDGVFARAAAAYGLAPAGALAS